MGRSGQGFFFEPLVEQGLNAGDLAAGIGQANAHEMLFAMARVKIKLGFSQPTLLGL
jgi:hypothetical protein